MRYWLYKNNAHSIQGGHWDQVFRRRSASDWGGHYSTTSAEVSNHLNDLMQAGDVVVAYQTEDKAVVGFCIVTRMTGPQDGKRIWLQPIQRLDPPFLIHDHKHGTVLENSSTVNGRVGLRELERPEMEEIVRLSGAPKRVLKGQPPPAGYKP